jgi:seryl-tRNA synthetase
MEQSKALKVKITEMEEKEKAVISARDKILCSMGNLVHDSVVVSKDEVGESDGMRPQRRHVGPQRDHFNRPAFSHC